MPELKRANIEIAKLKNALIYAEAIIETIHDPLIVLRPNLRIRTANLAFYKKFRLLPAEVEEKRIYEISNGQWDIPELDFFLKKFSIRRRQLMTLSSVIILKKPETELCFSMAAGY